MKGERIGVKRRGEGLLTLVLKQMAKARRYNSIFTITLPSRATTVELGESV
jgi:hypothetical protein